MFSAVGTPSIFSCVEGAGFLVSKALSAIKFGLATRGGLEAVHPFCWASPATSQCWAQQLQQQDPPCSVELWGVTAPIKVRPCSQQMWRHMVKGSLTDAMSMCFSSDLLLQNVIFLFPHKLQEVSWVVFSESWIGFMQLPWVTERCEWPRSVLGWRNVKAA